jgi:glycosyltransferase involved in cell wall biosynthesis
LFETFSVTPVEALVTGTPLVASDRDFVRDVCGDAPWYAEPTDPDALANALAEALSVDAPARIERGKMQARSLPNARSRATSYLALIDAAVHEMASPDRQRRWATQGGR